MSAPRDVSATMMADEKTWPAWPRLPLKRDTDEPFGDLAWMVAPSMYAEPTLVVVEGLIFEPLTNASKVKHYPDVEAVLDDGWRVD